LGVFGCGFLRVEESRGRVTRRGMTSVVVRDIVGPCLCVCVCVDGFTSRLAARAVNADLSCRF
jgi:hypothetical protein